VPETVLWQSINNSNISGDSTSVFLSKTLHGISVRIGTARPTNVSFYKRRGLRVCLLFQSLEKAEAVAEASCGAGAANSPDGRLMGVVATGKCVEVRV
jgi:hypothetical protein